MTGDIAREGNMGPIQPGQRWHVGRSNAWHNGFKRLQRCYEHNEVAIESGQDCNTHHRYEVLPRF